jgi:uncharacterized transporter YbjL
MIWFVNKILLLIFFFLWNFVRNVKLDILDVKMKGTLFYGLFFGFICACVCFTEEDIQGMKLNQNLKKIL